MTDLPTLALDLIAGFVLGAVFYGGLWWTVRRLSPRVPGLWLLGSFLVRTTVALAGLYAVARNAWEGCIVWLVGFLAARIAVMWITQVRRAGAERAS